MNEIEDKLNKLVVSDPEYIKTLIKKLQQKLCILPAPTPKPSPEDHVHMISYGTTCGTCHQTYWFPRHSSCPNCHDDGGFNPISMFGIN